MPERVTGRADPAGVDVDVDGRASPRGNGNGDGRPGPSDHRSTPNSIRRSGDGNGGARLSGAHGRRSHFEFAPPRHFLYPAILLLVGEQARHGYRLVDAILRLGFGPVDRPSVYRALSALAADGLLDCRESSSTAATRRQVYELTDRGRQQLAAWIDVIARERDALGGIVRRYEAWDV